MANRYRVTEIVQQAYVFEVEAESEKQAIDKVRGGEILRHEARAVRTKQLEAAYEAKEIG